ncbi:MAG: response regulator [Spirochaetales bacterium]|nr:response regulator [Spirochaetales bacterium]
MIQVLLVDDEEFSQKGMENLVPWEQWNCEIAAVASNGVEALEIINSQKIDLVFTDIKMPEMDGLELIREVNNINSGIDFVIITGYGEFEYAQKALRYGVRNYLLKPVGISEIEETLLKLTRNRIPDLEVQESPESCEIDIESFVEEIMVSVTQKNWNKISEILLAFIKDISSRNCSLEQTRIHAINLLSLLIKNEVIYSNEKTLLLAGEIGSADNQSVIYNILKDQIMMTQNQGERSFSKKMNPHVQKVLIYLIKHYKDKNLTLKWLSENIAYVKSDYLGKLFLSETGKTFAQYLAEFRIARAVEYQKQNPAIPVYDLAKLCGYRDNVSYFIQQYKKITGMTPAEFASSSVVNT